MIRAAKTALAVLALAASIEVAAAPAAERGIVNDLLAELLGDDGSEQPPPATGAVPSAAGGNLRTATTGNDSELVKTIPIGRRAGAKQRVVMSLGPAGLGVLQEGDVLYATAEVEVSVCLKPNEIHGSERSCIGRTYGYDPAVRAELVLGGEGAAGSDTVGLGTSKLTCAQTQPNRNHHCVLVIDDGILRIGDPGSLPCAPESCHLNLVLSANDKRAKPKDRLVVGADADGKSVNGDKGRVNVSRFRPALGERITPLTTEAKLRRGIPIAAEGGDVKEASIYSIELQGLRAGEQLVIDGKVVSRIGMHRYNTFQTTSLVLSEGPNSTSREGWPERVGDLNGQVAEANGFNCTQGDSAHSDPCTARKVGVLEITRDSPKVLYVNLVAGMAAQLYGEHHRRGDQAKLTGDGFLRVYRFPAERNDSPPEVRE